VVTDEKRELNTLLVATDFSASARVALDRAIELASPSGAKIILVHVIVPEPIPVGGPAVLVVPQGMADRLREASERALEQLAGQVREQGIQVETILESGAGAPGILDSAQISQADLIVIGTRGNSGFKHLLLGSVAEAVVRDAAAPVLTVHPEDTRSLADIRHVLMPTDFSDDARYALQRLTACLPGLARNARLTLVHAYQVPAVFMPLAGLAPEMPVLMEDARELAHAALDPLADELRAAGREVDIVGREGNPANVISELTQSDDVDLVVMGTRGLSKFKQVLLGSTAERVVQHAGCPVLTVRRES
jgi:nucleotide-binding universal stress UspA family protein